MTRKPTIELARWDLFADPVVSDIAKQAARRVYRKVSQHGIELEDLLQEARIAIATKPNVTCLLEPDMQEYGLAQFAIERHLIDVSKKRVRHAILSDSLDAYDDPEQDEAIPALKSFVPDAALSSDYNRELVELLLPGVCDESYCYSLPQREHAPDPDMPRGTTNPRTANNLPAYIADIKTGWERSGLTFKERRAVLMSYGLGWRTVEVAAHENVSRRTIERRLETAVGKIVARLNGGIWHELAEVEA